MGFRSAEHQGLTKNVHLHARPPPDVGGRQIAGVADGGGDERPEEIMPGSPVKANYRRLRVIIGDANKGRRVLGAEPTSGPELLLLNMPPTWALMA